MNSPLTRTIGKALARSAGGCLQAAMDLMDNTGQCPLSECGGGVCAFLCGELGECLERCPVGTSRVYTVESTALI